MAAKRILEVEGDLAPRTVARVLLADENEPTRIDAESVLIEDGYEVAVVDNGVAALELSRDEEFDCILVSRDLPGLSGVE